MPDVSQLSSELRGLPDQALQHELQQPSGLVPSYLVLAEAQRRSLMRQAAQQDQSKQQSSTVLQDVVRNMMAQQPPPGAPPVGMASGRQGQGPMPGAQAPGAMPTPTPPQPPPQTAGMARGGPLRFDDGGSLPDYKTLSSTPGSPDWNYQTAPSADAGSGDIDGWINKYSQQYGVDPDMARAIMQQESAGNPKAMGPPTRHGRAIGLFQLMPYTAHDMGVDPMKPEENVKGGIKYYSQLLQKPFINGDHQLALAAFNAGPGAVAHYGGVPPFAQTQAYVPAIMGNYAKLKERQVAQTRPAFIPPPGPQQPADDAAPPEAGPPAPEAPPEEPAALAGAMPDIQPPPQQAAQAAPQATPQAETIPSTSQLDPYSPANIDRMRHTMDALEGVSPEYRQQLAQTRAATIAQLQGLQQEQLARYHNPSPWEFLSSIAAGMGASHSLNLAGAFGEGVGHAWQTRDQQQQTALSNIDALQQRIDAVQNVGESERERMAGQMVTMLTRPDAGLGEFEKFMAFPNVSYGQKDKPPGPDYAFKEDPRQPGWGAWIPTGQALKPAKPASRADQEFSAAVDNVSTQYGLPKGTPFGKMPAAIKLDRPVTLMQPMPQADGSVLKAGTVLPVGTTVYPQREAQLLADRAKTDLSEHNAASRLAGTVEGRQQLANDPAFMPGASQEQKDYYIRTGKQAENIDSLAMAVANYQIPLQTAMSRGALSDRNALIEKIRSINPQYNLGEQEAQYKGFQQTEKNFDSGKQADRVQNTATLVHHLGVLYDAANALQTGDFRGLNGIANSLNKQLGPTPADTFRTIVHAVGPETTKAYIASGGTYQDRAELEKDFSENLPPAQLRANISSRAQLLGGVMTPLAQEYVNGTYGRGTRHLGFFSPETIGGLYRLAPNAVKTMTQQQLQQFANQSTGGDLAAARKQAADAGIFLRP